MRGSDARTRHAPLHPESVQSVAVQDSQQRISRFRSERRLALRERLNRTPRPGKGRQQRLLLGLLQAPERLALLLTPLPMSSRRNRPIRHTHRPDIASIGCSIRSSCGAGTTQTPFSPSKDETLVRAAFGTIVRRQSNHSAAPIDPSKMAGARSRRARGQLVVRDFVEIGFYSILDRR